MPFTVAHVAVVLPLRGRWRLPLAPLVLGSMAPDVWLFLGLPRMRDLAHTALGVVTVDLLVVVVAGATWHHLLRAPVADLLPSLSARWARPSPGARAAPVVPWAGRWLLAGLLGVLTHVVWDGFTHDSGWAVQHVGLLRASVLGLSLATWLQYLCSVLGMVVVAVFVRRWWRSTPAGPPVTAGLLGARGRVAVWATVALAAVAGAAYRAAGPLAVALGTAGRPPQVGPWRLRVLVTDALLGIGVGSAVAVLLLALGWQAALRVGRPRRAGAVRVPQP